MNIVLGASAMIAFFKDEDGAEAVEAILKRENDVFSMHALNMCEVYYEFFREYGEEGAQRVIDTVRSMGIDVREDLDEGLWKQAGAYKADLRRVSVADCFCLALAGRLDAEIITADRHEMESVSQLGIHPIRFIR